MTSTTLAWVDWGATQREIEETIRVKLPNLKFVKTARISAAVATAGGEMAGLAEKARRSRISTALRKDVLKTGWKQWNGREDQGGNRNGSGPTWIVPWE